MWNRVGKLSMLPTCVEEYVSCLLTASDRHLPPQSIPLPSHSESSFRNPRSDSNDGGRERRRVEKKLNPLSTLLQSLVLVVSYGVVEHRFVCGSKKGEYHFFLLQLLVFL